MKERIAGNILYEQDRPTVELFTADSVGALHVYRMFLERGVRNVINVVN